MHVVYTFSRCALLSAPLVLMIFLSCWKPEFGLTTAMLCSGQLKVGITQHSPQISHARSCRYPDVVLLMPAKHTFTTTFAASLPFSATVTNDFCVFTSMCLARGSPPGLLVAALLLSQNTDMSLSPRNSAYHISKNGHVRLTPRLTRGCRSPSGAHPRINVPAQFCCPTRVDHRSYAATLS